MYAKISFERLVQEMWNENTSKIIHYIRSFAINHTIPIR